MHKTSFLKAQAFFDTYVEPRLEAGKTFSVLDIGSRTYREQALSYKKVFDRKGIRYVGLDVSAGENVDLVPSDAFVWKEIADEEFDCCISGQVFEHNPFFWVTFAEVARVLKPGGLALVVAPGRGIVHRFPLDCWRFYPDAWQALCVYCGLECLESYFEEYDFRRIESGSEWCDSAAVAQKPRLEDEARRTAFYARLDAIVATIPANAWDKVVETRHHEGPWRARYIKQNEFPTLSALYHRLRHPKSVVWRILNTL